MRPINSGFRYLKGSLFFWKLYRVLLILKTSFILSLTKFNSPFLFRQKKKTWIREQQDKSFLLTKYYSYWNVLYLVKMRNLSLVSIWSLRSLRKMFAIAAIIRKPLSSDRSDRSHNDRWDRKSSISAIAGKWFPYDRCDRWEKKSSAIAAIAATTIAEIEKVLSQWSLSLRSLESGFHMIAELFFFCQRSQRSQRS